MGFIENLFICGVLAICFLAAYGIVCLVGLLVWKLRGRDRRIKGYYAVGRVL